MRNGEGEEWRERGKKEWRAERADEAGDVTRARVSARRRRHPRGCVTQKPASPRTQATSPAIGPAPPRGRRTGGSSSARPTASGARSWARTTRPVILDVDQGQQRDGIPAQVGAGREECAFPRPPLRKPDHFGQATEDLARPTAGEAHQVTERTRYRAAAVDVEAVLPRTRQCLHPPGADPLGGGGHVGQPERVVPGHPDIDPQLFARPEIDGPSPAAPASQLHLPLPQGGDVDELRGLGAAEHQRRPRPRHGRPPGAVTRCGTARRRRRGRKTKTKTKTKRNRKRATVRMPWRDTAPTTGPHRTGVATARGARPAEPASRSSSSPAPRGADRP